MTEKPRRKMNLTEQSAFIRGLADRCQMQSPEYRGEYVFQSVNLLTAHEYENLTIVADTLQFLDVHGAEQMIRDKFFGKRGRHGGGR